METLVSFNSSPNPQRNIKIIIQFLDPISDLHDPRGCVTAKVISNMKESALDKNGEFTTDLVDGFSELDADNQEKIRTALEVGNVADEDWKGAPGGNLPNPPKAKKAKAEDKEDDDSEEAE
jgi:hypothetical protein